jgi:uncharacterized protein YcnI
MLILIPARRGAAAGWCVAVLAALLAPAHAHPVLAQSKAEAGTFFKASIGITHGCKGTPTREVMVRIPAGVQGAKPMPKPGWTVSVERAPLDAPRESHGRRITEDVTLVRWSGGTLPNEQYDEFSVVATLPAQPGPLYWLVSQKCEQGGYEWKDIPMPGQDPHSLQSPAVRLEVTPAVPAAHNHH